MKSALTVKSDTSANSTSDPSTPVPESPPVAIQDRLVVGMFLIVGFLFGIMLLVDLLSGLFR